MSSRAIRCEPLAAAAFAPFGTVIAAGGRAPESANDARAERFSRVAELSRGGASSRPLRLETAVYRIAASALPLEVGYFERHPLSAQLFYPGTGSAFLVCVCLADGAGAPDPATVRAFRGAGPQGVVYAPGIWHFPLVALDSPAEFLMQMWAADGDADCEVATLAVPLRIAG